mmetsp:Transcript_28310/g.66999  ORF Transcript_28310/g.66999 Transcript_28310/m.66999 type:complete len:135 (-) Transcript_28310:42-446(-)
MMSALPLISPLQCPCVCCLSLCLSPFFLCLLLSLSLPTKPPHPLSQALITFLSGDILVVPTSLSTATNSAVNLAGAELVGNEPSRSQRRLDEDTPLRHKTPQHTPSSTPKAIHPDVIHEAVDLQDPSLAGLKFV